MPGAQVAQVAHLLSAQADAAQRRVVERGDCRGARDRLSGNSATNRPKIVAAALVESCWLTIDPTSAVR